MLNPLLGRPDLQGESATRAMELALQWLPGFIERPDAGFVLTTLLGRPDLEGESATRVSQWERARVRVASAQ